MQNASTGANSTNQTTNTTKSTNEISKNRPRNKGTAHDEPKLLLPQKLFQFDLHLSQFNFLYISSHSNTSLRVTFALFLLVQCMIERRWQTENYHLVFWLGWIFATLSVYCQTNRILFYIFGWHEFHSHGATANTIRHTENFRYINFSLR